ncbi:MAG TPA: anti-sigma factor [Sporichthyaceae bacterium]|jgi:anti-sigma-K factor RskA|nr:anti-sigma factor [Sporichthyaceae bacterium]
MSVDWHSLTGAYATGALDADENELFVAHLADCAQCRLEVRELLETTALLGVAAAQPAPPGMRTAVLAEVARTRQMSPVVVSLTEHATRGTRSLRRWGMSVAACLAVLGIGLGAYTWRLHDENSDLHARLAAPAATPDDYSVSAAGNGWTAQVSMSRSANQVQFVCQGLAAPASGRTYQIWLIGPNGPRSAGTFSPNQNRPATRSFTGPGEATTLAITEEPSGGSAQPTTKPFLVMPLSST